MATNEGPDQGRAWVVAFAACIINMILSGISRMIGMLYVAVIVAYGVSRQEATLPFTARNAIRCLSGPIVGMCGQRYGIRKVTICGGIVAALGAALCSVAPSITWLTVFWGGIHGIGFAFANTLFQVVVNQYFEKHRATASGIALSGACLGSLAFPFMMEFFLEKFSLPGTFLMLGGVVMHVLPPALLLSAPPWLKKKKSPKRNKLNDKDALRSNEDEIKRCMQLSNSTSMSNNPIEGIEIISVRRLTEGDHFTLDTKRNRQRVVTVKTIFNGTNGVNTIDVTDDHHVVPISTEREREEDHQQGATSMSNFKTLLHLYSNPVYVLTNICMATYIIIFIPILTVIVDYGVDKGLPESAGKYLINSMACGDLIGRLCFGWVTDRGFMTVPRFMTLTLVLQGVIIALFPFAMTLLSFMILLALYGIMAGSILVLFPIVVFKYVSTEVQPVAMGCVGFLSGMVSFSIPPLIGHFRDNVGSYDGMFYITGGISLISGGLWVLEPILAKAYPLKQAEEMNAKVTT